MCIECGASQDVHFKSCSRYTEDVNDDEYSQYARGSAALYDMVNDRMEVSLLNLVEAQTRDSVFGQLLSEATVATMAKSAVWQVMNEDNYSTVRTLASMHMLAILIENDIVDSDKLAELLLTLGWSAPDAIG